MAQVPLDNVPNVSANPNPPSDYQQISASPDQFGSLSARGAAQLGQGLEQSAQATTDIAVQQQSRQNEIRTNDTFNKFQDYILKRTYGDPSDPAAPKGLYTLTGSDALAAGPGAAKDLSSFREQLKNGLQNDAQKLQFDEQSRRILQYTQGEISRHLDSQEKAYNLATNQNTIAVAGRAASLQYNSPDAINHNLEDARGAAVRSAQDRLGHNLSPVDLQAAIQASDAHVLQQAAEGALAAEDMGSLDKMVGQFGDRMDPRFRAGLVKKIQTQKDDLADNAYIQSLPGMSGGGGIKDAIHGQESGGRMTSPTSVDGAHGPMQIKPATFQQYAQPGERIDNPHDNLAVGNRIIDDLSAKTNGDPARIAVGYFSGPGNVAPPGSPTPWIHNSVDGNGKSVSKYVSDVLSRITPGSSSPAFPDESAAAVKIINDTRGDPERQARLLSKMQHTMSVIKMATATDRADLDKSLPDLQAAALNGQDVTIPTDRINHLLPPAQAADELEKLNTARQAGQIFKGVQFGTPESIANTYKYLSADQGSEQYRERHQVLDMFDKQVKARQAALSTDPAAYVTAEPSVQAAAQAVAASPNDPAAISKFVTTNLAVQKQLGVRDEDTHIMTKQVAQQTAKQLMTVDPATGDMGKQLSDMAASYGDAWPKAFGDLVTMGKLPAEYQVLAAMPDPASRTQYQRALAATAKKGGIAALKNDVPPDAVKDIDQGLDAAVDPFRQTAAIPGLTNNVGLISTVRDAIKTYAYFDAMQTGDGAGALKRAESAVLTDKYDFSGTMRVPKGMLPAVESAASNVTSNLKPEDLAPLAADTMATKDAAGLTVEQRQAITMDAAQRGKWIPNETDTGLVLVGQLRNGAMVRMQRSDGGRIQLNFKDIAAQPPMPGLLGRLGNSLGSIMPGQPGT